jgi:Fe-S oxidoreductase
MKTQDAISVLNHYSTDCIDCGFCVTTCPQHLFGEYNPQEIATQILRGSPSQEIIDLIERCDLCGLCTQGCMADLNPKKMVIAAREVLISQGRINLDDFAVMQTDRDWNTFSIYRETFNIHYSDLEKPTCEALFFPGCSLATYTPVLTRAAYHWLEGQGIQVGFSDLCCGKPLSSIGLRERAESLQQFLSAKMQTTGADTLITACPSCFYQLNSAMPGIKVVSLLHLMQASGIRISDNDVATIHDSCPDRENLIFAEDGRLLLYKTNVVEMTHHMQSLLCCGSGGIVSMVDPDLCEQRSQLRWQEFASSGATKLITYCLSCAQRLARSSKDTPVSHILELIFGINVDYAQVQANLESMWKGEQGTANMERLAAAVRFSNDRGSDHG